MASLVLEGGTLRPIFSAGVMDALLDHEVMFPYCIGVSAGISNGISYLSQQKERNLQIMKQFRNDKRYIGMGNYLRSRSLFGLDFVFDEIPNRLLPFDMEQYQKYEGKVLVGVTNAQTGKTEYWDGKKADKQWTMMRATCAIPLFFPAIRMENQPYYDGGLTDPIPVAKAIADGQDKHLIVLTQPEGYRKELSKQAKLVSRVMRRKYPALEQVLLTRHEVYNRTIELCEDLQQQGKAILIRPAYKLESFEKSFDNLQHNYQHGYDLASHMMPQIKELLA